MTIRLGGSANLLAERPSRWLALALVLSLFPTGFVAQTSRYALNPGDVLAISVWKEEGLEREVFKLAEELRTQGISAVYDLDRKSVKAQMKAANKGGHRYAVILGSAELERGAVQVKDLEAGEQNEVPRAALVETLAG